MSHPPGLGPEPTKGKVVVGMTVSLDGYVADEHGSATRLYPDLGDLQGDPSMEALIEDTGAVLMGRRTFEMGDPDAYVGNHEFQVPISCSPAVHRRHRRNRTIASPSPS